MEHDRINEEYIQNKGATPIQLNFGLNLTHRSGGGATASSDRTPQQLAANSAGGAFSIGTPSGGGSIAPQTPQSVQVGPVSSGNTNSRAANTSLAHASRMSAGVPAGSGLVAG